MTRQELEFTFLLECFEALFVHAKAFSEACSGRGDAKPYAHHEALKATLTELESLAQQVRAELHEAQEIPELTAEDFEHSLRRSERHRMIRGEFQAGDLEKLRKWCRLTPEEMARAFNMPIEWYEYWAREEVIPSNGMHPLLRVAAMSPGVVRRLAAPPKEPGA